MNRPVDDQEHTPIDPARQAAVEVLAAVRERDAYANLVLPKMLRDRTITGRDAALATELTYGTSRAVGLLDQIIAEVAKRPVEKIDGVVLDVLRLGAYQLLRTRIGAHAAVSTSVDLVRSRAGHGPVGFANAVLRKISQRTEELWVEALAPPISEDLIGHLAFQYAHPRWIAEVFDDALGGSAGALQAALAADDERPSTHLVARPGMITADELAAVTGGAVGRYSPYCVYVDSGDPGDIEPIREGLAGVQDEGSQLVARALAIAPLDGDDAGRWLDLCAGPGGKAALLGALADMDGARVTAVEKAPHRAELIRKATRELPVDVMVGDGRDPGLEPGFDRVLVDVPCTGLGALRRRPEARWRRNPGDVPDLVALQKQLLASAVDQLRPGGVVVYSTCSPHPAETREVADWAIAELPVTALETRDLVPVDGLTGGPYVQLWPHLHGTDAMFFAALRKN